MMNLPQFDWPENPKLAQRFSEWLSEFSALCEREPNVSEMLEWAYTDGEGIISENTTLE